MQYRSGLIVDQVLEERRSDTTKNSVLPFLDGSWEGAVAAVNRISNLRPAILHR